MTSKLPALYIPETIPGGDIYQHAVGAIVCHRQTQYQELLIVESESLGRSLILDRLWQSSERDEFIYHEGLVQPAALLQGAPKQALILGGGEGATLREVLRWKSIERVVMVDIDEEVVNECIRHLEVMHRGSFFDGRVELRFQEARQFLRETQCQWDLVIADLTDPSPEGPAKDLYTPDTFRLFRKVLRRGGIFVTQAGPLSPLPQSVDAHRELLRAVGESFEQRTSYALPVGTLPVTWGFVVGSREQLLALPMPTDIDLLLERLTTGGLRLIDGHSLAGIFQQPRYVRNHLRD